jgi:hypothetical protein
VIYIRRVSYIVRNGRRRDSLSLGWQTFIPRILGTGNIQYTTARLLLLRKEFSVDRKVESKAPLHSAPIYYMDGFHTQVYSIRCQPYSSLRCARPLLWNLGGLNASMSQKVNGADPLSGRVSSRRIHFVIFYPWSNRQHRAYKCNDSDLRTKAKRFLPELQECGWKSTAQAYVMYLATQKSEKAFEGKVPWAGTRRFMQTAQRYLSAVCYVSTTSFYSAAIAGILRHQALLAT